MRKETGVTFRHTRRCPRKAGGGYAPHKCTGTWSYVVDVGRDSNGKRIQETKGGFLTKQEAREARAARVTLLSSRTADAHRLTVGDFLEQWLEGKRKLGPSTLASYREYIDGVFKPHIGSLRLVELERHPEQLDRMFTALAQPGENGRRLAVGTIHRMYGALRAALNVAVRRTAHHLQSRADDRAGGAAASPDRGLDRRAGADVVSLAAKRKGHADTGHAHNDVTAMSPHKIN